VSFRHFRYFRQHAKAKIRVSMAWLFVESGQIVA
jgi:hypothetical protein